MNEELARHLRKGGIAAVYDGDDREGEADLVFHPSFVSPEKISLMRREAGGLICFAMEKQIADALGLPFYSSLLSSAGLDKINCKKTAYGDTPAFSLQVNYKGVYTGITDNDRALTIRELGKVAEMKPPEAEKYFFGNFYSPGHVFLLISRGIESRKGHTELSVSMMKKAGLSGTAVLCEMLGDGDALSKKRAGEYAEKNNLLFIEGRDLI